MGKRKRKLTAAEKAEKMRRQKEFMTIFINGLQVHYLRALSSSAINISCPQSLQYDCMMERFVPMRTNLLCGEGSGTSVARSPLDSRCRNRGLTAYEARRGRSVLSVAACSRAGTSRGASRNEGRGS